MGPIVERLAEAINAHDLEAMVDCFTEDYRSEIPLHPARSFVGREQVRRNWAQIFAGVPDIRAEVLRSTGDGEIEWPEWEMRGTRPVGSEHLMRGVTVLGVRNGRIAWSRFYLEPVENSGPAIDAAVRQAVGR